MHSSPERMASMERSLTKAKMRDVIPPVSASICFSDFTFRLDFFSNGMAAMRVWIISENSASSRQFGR
jgi:hypothetical protein